MSRYIDADDFFEEFEELDKEPYINYPATDVRENVKGEWEYIEDIMRSCSAFKCSACGCYASSNYNFCPNCGADMRGE